MYHVLKAKFTQHPDLLKKLKQINEPIIEENHWNDTYWGTCNGVGHNYLGRFLTRIKNELEVNDDKNS